MNTAASLQAVVRQLVQSPLTPDLLLLTGDLSQDETVASYQNLQTWLTPLGCPSYWLPGNHDNLDNLHAALTDARCSTQQSFQRGGWKFLLLNSQRVGQVEGYLSSQTLVWLTLELEQDPNLPTLIALHHPPFPVGSPWIDKISLQDPEPFLALCDRHPQIKVVLGGHVHQAARYDRGGVCYLTCPSTCVQFLQNSSAFGIDTTPPGYRQLSLYPDGRFETEIVRVPEHMVAPADPTAKGY
jgi:Icc protein